MRWAEQLAGPQEAQRQARVPLTGAIEGGISGGVAGLSSSGAPGSSGGAATGAPGATSGGFTPDALSGTSIQGLTTPPANLGDIAPPGGTGSLGLTNALETGAANANTGLSGPITFSGGSPISAATGPATAAGGAGAAAPSGFWNAASNFVQNPSLSTAGTALSNVPPGLALGAGGLAYDAIKGQQPIPNLSNIESQAQSLAAGGQTLLGPLEGGPLPAGAQSAINQGVQSAQAAIRSKYASMGLSGSPMEQDELNQAQETAIQQQFQVAQQMAGVGAQITGLDISTYNDIINAKLTQDKELQDAIASFAGAAAGGGVNVRIPTGNP